VLGQVAKSVLKCCIPPAWRPACRRLWRRVRFYGWARRCPVCRSRLRRFLPHGVIERPDAVCPVCGSRERHRLAWLYLERRTEVFRSPATFLHLAAEREFSRRLSRLGHLRYVTGDLKWGAMIRMDAARMPFPDAVADLVYCCHVLNMMPDDAPAIRELARVLKPDGRALIQAPVTGDRTVECPDDSTPEERRRIFGDPAVYRRYGLDFERRLKAGGLAVLETDFHTRLSPRERRLFGLRDPCLYVCGRASPSGDRERPR